MPRWEFLHDEINLWKSLERLRERRPATPEGQVDACSNDYLGYGHSGSWVSRTGAMGSRLVVGDSQEHLALERELASWVGMPEALLFTSGYCANLGVVSALAGPEDLVVSAHLNHASIIDGCRLSRARVEVVQLGDLDAVRRALARPARRKIVVTESYFSMDGLAPDLAGLRAECDLADAMLIVDEAHALGVFGEAGAGLCQARGVRADLLVGTLGKAVSAQGAFAAGDPTVVLYLWNRARSFVFSTGMSPRLCEVALANVRRAILDEAGRKRIVQNALRLRALLAAEGVSVVEGSFGPIVPVVVGDSAKAVAMEAALCALGFAVRAIRAPTVPPGTERLRVTVHAGMDDETVDRLGRALVESRQ